MARPEKVAVVDEIRTKLDEADAAVLTEYRGLTVHELAELRASLRQTDTQYKVFKNSLARRAIEGRGLDEITDLFEGPVAIAFVHGDAAAAAKALREFGRSHDALVLKGGLLGERVITPNEIQALADLPSREVLLTQIAGVFQAPLTRAAGLFQAFTRNFAYGVQALIDQRVAGGEAAPVDEAPVEDASADDAATDDVPAADAPADDAPAAEAEDAPAEADAAGEPPSESEQATESE
jgi:large subunit ribosomal protein L10